MAKTFAELAVQNVITAAELIETLQVYATCGAAVSHPVVCGLIDRVSPNEAEKKELKQWTQIGIHRQKSLNQAAAMYHYQVVLTHLTLGRRL